MSFGFVGAVLFALVAVQANSYPGYVHEKSVTEDTKCEISSDDFLTEYSAVVRGLGIVDPQTGQSCSLEELQAAQQDYLEEEYEVCETLFNFTVQLLTGLNVTSECCLTNSSQCYQESNSTTSPPNKAKVYGLGTAMVVGLCLLSLLGVIIIPLMKKCGVVYDHTLLFLMALGTSALFSDAVLHLLPQVFLVHSLESGRGMLTYLWRACAVAGGMYGFYLFESLLHRMIESKEATSTSSHSNNTGRPHSTSNGSPESPDPRQHLIETNGSLNQSNHGTIDSPKVVYSDIKKSRCCVSIKPLAVLIIVGDAFHNFTDGLTLGASIAQNLALGISTIIALVFHEVPHELGDFAILLSTGMSWPVALFFNFLSSLTSLAGFFIGVSVGLDCRVANVWMLAVAAGTFFYISLVDLLPILMHSKLKGPLAVFLVNFGFVISFAVLLVVAIYEHEIEMSS